MIGNIYNFFFIFTFPGPNTGGQKEKKVLGEELCTVSKFK